MDTIPEDFLCPISFEIMTEPVICEDGITYDKQSIMKYDKDTSPVTRQPIDKTKLIPNRALKNMIEKYISKQNNIIDIDESTKSLLINEYKTKKELYTKLLNEKINSETSARLTKEQKLTKILNDFNNDSPTLVCRVGSITDNVKYTITMDSINLILADDVDDIKKLYKECIGNLEWLEKYHTTEGKRKYVDFVFDSIINDLSACISDCQMLYETHNTDIFYYQVEFFKSLRKIDKPREYYYENFDDLDFNSRYYLKKTYGMTHWYDVYLLKLDNVITNIGFNLMKKYNMDTIVRRQLENALYLLLPSTVDYSIVDMHRRELLIKNEVIINNVVHTDVEKHTDITTLITLMRSLCDLILDLRDDIE